jgi:hypothetical protein
LLLTKASNTLVVKLKNTRFTIPFLLMLSLSWSCTQVVQEETEKVVPEALGSVKDGAERQYIFTELKRMDSLLFQRGFNTCDTHQLRSLISDDFEFYHDQAGLNTSKEAFIASISGLCDLPYKPSRELDEKSLEVHLLREKGELYGAIQKGKHCFFKEEADGRKMLSSTADFIHLWIIESSGWKLQRVLSYNHRESVNK